SRGASGARRTGIWLTAWQSGSEIGQTRRRILEELRRQVAIAAEAALDVFPPHPAAEGEGPRALSVPSRLFEEVEKERVLPTGKIREPQEGAQAEELHERAFEGRHRLGYARGHRHLLLAEERLLENGALLLGRELPVGPLCRVHAAEGIEERLGHDAPGH